MIAWKEEYTTGIPVCDEQHRKLVEIAQRAFALLKNDLSLDKFDKILVIMEELKDYTVYHFKSEEEYMKTVGYSKFLSHKVEHDDFIEKVNAIDLYKVDDNQDQYITEILNFLVNWIDKHILGRDKLITAK